MILALFALPLAALCLALMAWGIATHKTGE